ncbi:hypothetical protein PAAG_12048 [Paracoccidioides lutzii Pb01]|uniref:Uncharacterized protein n=1 Tax=Paracoccidioides lutzii (strain ATCC MYA-826 / Pb01) TaxID=502779 RepID=A0A0A2V4J8_PARBA|nr:hypothetical protein PAAG_12048 [Paracoccidioides lutzii Pb01]KGQ01277.1 hypothetical protein PAAG_12048 [Paracoccidioides lutzii Pb01]
MLLIDNVKRRDAYELLTTSLVRHCLYSFRTSTSHCFISISPYLSPHLFTVLLPHSIRITCVSDGLATGSPPGALRSCDATVRLVQFQVISKKYADATIIAINRVQCFWDRHCTFMGVDAQSHLSACSTITIRVEWKLLPLLFKRETGRKVDELVGELISESILGPLTDLDPSIDYKLVVSMEGLVAILHYHWCLDTASVTRERYTLQNPLLMFIACTSTLPGALIESGCLWFQMMPSAKGYCAATAYIFHERDGNLALCPVSCFLPLALDDDAFDASGIKSVEDVLRIRVTAPRNSLHLKWKPHMLNIPVFHRAIHAAEWIRISPDNALPYDAFNQYLQRLERNSGFEHKLTPYCIRRGTANRVDIVATTSERNQVMGQSRADIFERYYISALTRDPCASKELSKEHKQAIEQDPQLIKLCDRQRSMQKLMERKYGSVLKARGSELHR